jgi:hypothetical protein
MKGVALMPIHEVKIEWNTQDGVTNISCPTLKNRLGRKDRVKFVAVAGGTPLVLFPKESPFVKDVRPQWIVGSDTRAVKRTRSSARSRQFSFRCAVLDNKEVHGGKGGKLPPIPPAQGGGGGR